MSLKDEELKELFNKRLVQEGPTEALEAVWPYLIARGMEKAQIECQMEISRLQTALKGMLNEWERFTRYGSPIAKASNEAANYAREVLSESPIKIG